MVDTRAPETAVTTGPTSLSASATAVLAFSADETATFACSLDGATFAGCTSPVGYSGLADGGHELRVVATDAAGNVDQTAASREWTVDTQAPQTTLTSGP